MVVNGLDLRSKSLKLDKLVFCLPKRKSLKLSLRLVVVLVEVEIGGCGFNLGSDQWGVAMGKDVGRLGLGGAMAPPIIYLFIYKLIYT